MSKVVSEISASGNVHHMNMDDMTIFASGDVAPQNDIAAALSVI